MLSGVLNKRESAHAGRKRLALALRMGMLVLAGCLVLPASAKVEAEYAVLDNGLRVILHRNPQAPIVSCRLFYVTGSVHEAAGHTGIAHLLEHMLFKGTHRVGVRDSVADAALEARLDSLMIRLEPSSSLDSAVRDSLRAVYDSVLSVQRQGLVKYELWEAYEKAGGTGLNAFTSDLMTAYIVTLPRNKVELFLWLEADRMQNAVLREFLPERDVVREERRMRVEDNPAGRYWESLMGVFYEAHPFRIPTIGYPSDIPQLTKRQAEAHYRDFYKPNNSILVLAGDLDIDSTLAAVKAYFGPIPRGEEFPPVTVQEPPQPGEKRLTVRRGDANPRLDMLFHTPGYPHPDLHALDVLEGALSGKSGRLYQKLVKEKKLALDAYAGNGVDKYTSTFYVSVSMDAQSDPEAVEKAVWEVLDDLQSHPLSDREIQRARNQVAARTERSLENMEGLATELAYWEMRRSWEDINGFPAAVQAVGAEAVRKVAAETFRREAATVGRILPPSDLKGKPAQPSKTAVGSKEVKR